MESMELPVASAASISKLSAVEIQHRTPSLETVELVGVILSPGRMSGSKMASLSSNSTMCCAQLVQWSKLFSECIESASRNRNGDRRTDMNICNDLYIIEL